MLRLETPADADAIGRLIELAFADHPHSSHTEQFIVTALRRAGALSLGLVAEQDGEVAGYLALSPVQISDGSTGWYGLGPLAVLPACQRRGLGAALIRDALARLQALGAAGCVLLGEPAYYQRFGFAAQAGLSLPGVPAEYFMATAFGTRLPQGEVSYHAAFAATA